VRAIIEPQGAAPDVQDFSRRRQEPVEQRRAGRARPRGRSARAARRRRFAPGRAEARRGGRWWTLALSGDVPFAYGAVTHTAREKDERRILRNRIKPQTYIDGFEVVCLMPATPDFFVSHQWLRELRRESAVPLVAVDFVIDDDEVVRVGHYSKPHAEMTAAEATGTIMRAEDPRGYEVAISRKILPSEIKRTRRIRQVVGWRYWPEAHGQPPCPCELCQRGAFGAAGLRRAD
jgi:hypothetical protein